MKGVIGFVSYSPVKNEFPRTYIFVRDEDKKRHILNIDHTNISDRPYFYCDPVELRSKGHLLPLVGDLPADRKDLYGRPLIRAVMKIPADVGQHRDKLTWTCEADVEWRLRTMIDLGVKLYFETLPNGKIVPAESSTARLNHGYVDIEVSGASKVFPDPEIAAEPIVFIALHSWYAEEPVGLMLKNPKWGSDEPWRNTPYGNRLLVFDTEEELLTTFLEILRDGVEVQFQDGTTEFFGEFDSWTGWNINFDISYIYNRSKRLGLKPEQGSPLGYWYSRGKEDWRIGGIELFDGLTAVKKWNESNADLPSWGYQFVKGHFLGEEYNRESSGGVIEKVWDTDVRELIRYGIEDAADIKVLFNRLNIWEYFDSIRELVGVSYKDSFSNLKVVNTWILRKAKSMGVALPTLKYEQKQLGAKGAAVFQPPPGLHEWVGVADVKSLYPTLIKTFNMSPETLVKDPIEFRNGSPFCDKSKWITVTYPVTSLPNGVRFRTDEKGIVPLIVEEAEAWRDKYRMLVAKYQVEGNVELEKLYDINQNTAKYLNSSIYGVLGNEAYILRNDIIRGCITYMGREQVIPGIKEFLEMHGLEAIYADTDSNFFKIPKVTNFEDAEHKGTEIIESLNKHLVKKLGTDKIFTKLDKVFKIMLFAISSDGVQAAKKNYAGLKKDGTINIMGFPAKRSDSCIITRTAQKSLFEILLKDRDIDKATNLVRAIRGRFMSGDIPVKDIAVPRGLGKSVEKYEGAAAQHPAIRGIKYAIDNLEVEIGTGSKPKYLYVKRRDNTSGLPDTDVISFEEEESIPDKFWKDFIVNKDQQFELTVRNKVQGIMSAVGVDWGEIVSGMKKTTLDGYETMTVWEEKAEQEQFLKRTRLPPDWDTRRLRDLMELDYGYNMKDLKDMTGLSEGMISLLTDKGRIEKVLETKKARGQIWWWRVI